MKFRHLASIAFVAAVGTTAACDNTGGPGDKAAGQGESTDKAARKGEAVATVNGQKITEDMFQMFARSRNRGQAMQMNEQQRQQMLDNLVKLQVLANKAREEGVDENPDVAARMKLTEMQMLAGALLEQHMADNPITDEDLRAEYDKRAGDQAGGGKEYKASHILVEKEETARDLIGQLDDGADFAELAREHSTGPSSEQGGDLGWFEPGQMVGPFSDKVAEMEKGEVTSDPVETRFGWHVIKLRDEREVQPPSFEDQRGQLQQTLQNQRIEEFVDKLRDEAQVETNLSSPEQAPAEGTESAEGTDSNEESAGA